MNMTEFEENSNFHLQECGTCSGWTYRVRCNKSFKIGVIQISKCKNEENYTVNGTSLDDECDLNEKKFPNLRDELLRFLIANYKRIDNSDPCESFHNEYQFCSNCNQPTLESENNI